MKGLMLFYRQLREQMWPSRILAWYLCALGIFTLARAMIHWAAILGADWAPAGSLALMSSPWQVATIYFACLGAISAVGLWFGAAWGVVSYLFFSLPQIIIHTAFTDTFGINQFAVVADVTSIIIYLALAWWAGSMENMGEIVRLPPE